MPELSFEDLAERAAGKTRQEVDLRPLLEAVASLLGLLPEDGAGADHLAREVSEVSSLEIPEDARPAFVEHLLALMSIPTLAIASRAMTVMSEFDKILHDVRILTDVRPVFEADVSTGVQAAGVIASMKLEYHPLGQSAIETVVISMDRSDLEYLSRVIGRALDKMDSLTELLKDTHVPKWNYNAHSHGIS